MTDNAQNIVQRINEKIQKQCAADYKKLEKEKNEIKQLKLNFKIQKTQFNIIIDEIKNSPDSEWEKFLEELMKPIEEQSLSISKKVDILAFKESKDIEEYKKYEKKKEISEKATEEIVEALEDANLSKKQLERYLLLLIIHIITNAVSQNQNSLFFYEFLKAKDIVERRFGFDVNWLVCMCLIQLHENLIKKKIVELKGEVKREEGINELISKLSKLIKENEGRSVSLSLFMAHSIKNIRDVMTHEGYKHQVLKEDLEKLYDEIADLEKTLYPEPKK